MSDVVESTTPPVIAELPPLKERRNSLAAALSHRPDQTDLVERNILHAGAPAIQQKQHDLEKAMATDALKKHLAKRPSKETLVQKNILPENNVAPALLAAQKELEKSMLEDVLKEKLLHRPAPEAVIEKGILSAEEDPTKV